MVKLDSKKQKKYALTSKKKFGEIESVNHALNVKNISFGSC